MKQIFLLTLILLQSVFLLSCASSFLKHKDAQVIQDQGEFDKVVHISDEVPAAESQPTAAAEKIQSTAQVKETHKAKAKHKKKAKKGKLEPISVSSGTLPPLPSHRQPELEDSEGFSGRRPIVDPFRPGEKVTLELSYFGVPAGDLSMEVRKFASVNGRKAYRFAASAQSRSVFAMIYAVDDWAETFLDFENMIPSSYALHVKESKQLREQRMYFDWTANKVHFWDKRVSSDSGVEEKKLEWDAQSYSQSLFSGPFYLRTFQLTPGKKLGFWVANEGKNYFFTGEILRRETIKVPAGEFKTVVIRPQIQVDGVFQPMGEILFWLTDDDRKFYVRIESKIKIGTIVGVAKKIDLGEGVPQPALPKEPVLNPDQGPANH